MQLRVSNLAAVRSGRPVFSGLDFQLGAGEALAVVGPNGSGKSTLLRIIAELLPAETGTVTLDGGEEGEPVAERVHYLGHRDPLKSSLSPRETLLFWQNLLGAPRLSPEEALTRVNLAHATDLPSGFLSAGQRRRLSLARLLVSHRPLWLLDEPSAALDRVSSELFESLVEAHLRAGGLVMAATHLPFGFQTGTLDLGARA
jgi:heme exporter protein A